MANIELRQEMKANFIPQWKVAEVLGVSEMTLIRWLRKELTEDKRIKVQQAIESLKAKKA